MCSIEQIKTKGTNTEGEWLPYLIKQYILLFNLKYRETSLALDLTKYNVENKEKFKKNNLETNIIEN